MPENASKLIFLDQIKALGLPQVFSKTYIIFCRDFFSNWGVGGAEAPYFIPVL